MRFLFSPIAQHRGNHFHARRFAGERNRVENVSDFPTDKAPEFYLLVFSGQLEGSCYSDLVGLRENRGAEQQAPHRLHAEEGGGRASEYCSCGLPENVRPKNRAINAGAFLDGNGTLCSDEPIPVLVANESDGRDLQRGGELSQLKFVLLPVGPERVCFGHRNTEGMRVCGICQYPRYARQKFKAVASSYASL